MNKSTLRTAITTAAIATTIIGIGAGTATAKPTLSNDGAGDPIGVMLGSDVPAGGVGENWTCTIRQGLTVAYENGTGLTDGNKVVINPTVGDWQPGPVSGYCLGAQGLVPVDGVAG